MHTRRLPKQFIYLLQTVVSHCKGSTQWIYHFSLSVVWPIKRTAESKLHCKKDFHEIIRQCSCLSHTQKHYTWFDHALHISFSLWTEFQVSNLFVNCSNGLILFFWLKAVGLQFIPRNDNHSIQILIWFSRPIWNKPCFTFTTFKDNGMMLLRHTVVDTPQCFSHLYL